MPAQGGAAYLRKKSTIEGNSPFRLVHIENHLLLFIFFLSHHGKRGAHNMPPSKL